MTRSAPGCWAQAVQGPFAGLETMEGNTEMEAWEDNESALQAAISRNMELRRPPIRERGGFFSQSERGCSCLKESIALALMSVLVAIILF